MKLRPALAAALPEVSADGLTYTYKLRQGVKFSDGKAFGAKDVVFTYRTILDEKTNNPSRTELDAVKDVTAKGEDTVVFTLKYPYAPFAQRTVLPIAPEHIAGKQDVNTRGLHHQADRHRAYVLTKWSKGEKLSFTANPDYWGGAPEVKKFTMAIIKDDDVRATRLRSGDLDGAILPPNLAKGFANDKAKKTYAANSYDYRTVTLPTNNKVAGDTDVRRALDVAVDRRDDGRRDPQRQRQARLRPGPHRQRVVHEGHGAQARPRRREEDPGRGRMEARQGRRPRQGRGARHLPSLVPQR